MDKKNNLLLIFAVGFVVVFSAVLILVNNWLKKTLQEESVPVSRVAVPSAQAPNYKQTPISPQVKQEAPAMQAIKSEREESTMQKSEEAEKEEFKQKPIAPQVLIN